MTRVVMDIAAMAPSPKGAAKTFIAMAATVCMRLRMSDGEPMTMIER